MHPSQRRARTPCRRATRAVEPLRSTEGRAGASLAGGCHECPRGAGLGCSGRPDALCGAICSIADGAVSTPGWARKSAQHAHRAAPTARSSANAAPSAPRSGPAPPRVCRSGAGALRPRGSRRAGALWPASAARVPRRWGAAERPARCTLPASTGDRRAVRSAQAERASGERPQRSAPSSRRPAACSGKKDPGTAAGAGSARARQVARAARVASR